MAVTGGILGAISALFGAIWAIFSRIFRGIGAIFNRIRSGIQRRAIRRMRRAQQRQQVVQFFRSTGKFIANAFRFFLRLLQSFFIVFFVIFQGFFGFFVYNTKRFLNDILQDGFGQPVSKARSTFDNFIIYLTIFFGSVRTSLMELLRSLIPLLAALPILIPVILLTIGITYLMSLFLPQTFVIINTLVNLFISFFDTAINTLNAISMTFASIAPTWNAYVDMLKVFIVESAKEFCSGAWTGTEFSFSGDLIADCPQINIFLNFISTTYNTIFYLFKVIGQFFGVILQIIESIICPNGTCSSATCLQYNGTPTCVFNFGMAASWFLQIIADITRFLFPVMIELLYFFVDFIAGVVNLFSSLYILLSGQQDSFNLFIKNLVDTNLPSQLATLPQTFTRDALIKINGLLYFIARWFVFAFREIGIVIDYIICNVFIQFLGCFLPKTCYFLFRDINFFLGYILTTPIYLYIPLSQVCVILGLSLGSCQCDACNYTSTIGITSLIALAINGIFGNLLVPCNPNGSCPAGCSSTNSVLSGILLL